MEIKEILLSVAKSLIIYTARMYINAIEDERLERLKRYTGSIVKLDDDLRVESSTQAIFVPKKRTKEIVIDRLQEVGYIIKEEVHKEVLYALSYPPKMKGIIIEGPPGTGKTFLAEKLAEALRLFPELRLIYLQSIGLAQAISTRNVLRTYKADFSEAFLPRLSSIAASISSLSISVDGEEIARKALKELVGSEEINEENILRAVIKGSDKALKEIAKLVEPKGSADPSRVFTVTPYLDVFKIGKERALERIKEAYPYVERLYSKEAIETGVLFEKYVCGREDEFSRIFGYRDIAKIAVVANLLGASQAREIEKEAEKLVDIFDELVYRSEKKIESLIRFFKAGPLFRARLFPGIAVMLVDEADKMGESAEVQFFEVLDRAYVSIDYFGILPRVSTLITFFTSNRMRSFSEPFIRRNVYTTIEMKEKYAADMIREVLESYYNPEIVAEVFFVGGEKKAKEAIRKFYDKVAEKYKKIFVERKVGIDEILDAVDAAIRIVAEQIGIEEVKLENLERNLLEALESVEATRIKKGRYA